MNEVDSYADAEQIFPKACVAWTAETETESRMSGANEMHGKTGEASLRLSGSERMNAQQRSMPNVLFFELCSAGRFRM